VTIKNKKVASIYYFIIFLVLCYVVGYTIILSKGYQAQGDISGTTTVKVKGSGAIGNDTVGLTPLDAMDLVVPSTEADALFVTTAINSTPNQTQSTCDGDDDAPPCTANDTSNCTLTQFDWNSQGIYTGECGSNDRCELSTWCPLEDDSIKDVVQNVGNFTIFVKVDVAFSTFDVQRSNTYDVNGDGSPTEGLNLFTVNEMLTAADPTISDYSDIATTGAILVVTSTWNCNFDRRVEDCNPVFSFERVDNVEDTISYGFNFRTVSYDATKQYRLLEKLYGVRIFFVVDGTGGKFNFAALTVTFGAGLAYLSIAKVVTDLILDNFMGRHSDIVTNFKYHTIADDDISSQQLLSEDDRQPIV